MMSLHDGSSYAEAIEYAVDEILVRDDEIAIPERSQLLSDRPDAIEDPELY
jgi:hypothetical protein